MACAYKVKPWNQLEFYKKAQPEKARFYRIRMLHEETFATIYCLDCGNCCKTAHPIFAKTDAARIADFLGMKVSRFEQTFSKWTKMET